MTAWEDVSEYKNRGDGISIDSEPLLLLWHKRYGLALGRVIRFPDGEVKTFAPSYHGFSFDKYSEIQEPTE